MSDEEEDYGEEEEEEGEEEDEEEDAEGGVEAGEEKRKELWREDIATMSEIFTYIDRTSRRISQELISDFRLKELQGEIDSRAHKRDGDDADIDEDSLHWSQYEDLDEGQRAQLLEKAINVLANDGGGGNTISRHNRR